MRGPTAAAVLGLLAGCTGDITVTVNPPPAAPPPAAVVCSPALVALLDPQSVADWQARGCYTAVYGDALAACPELDVSECTSILIDAVRAYPGLRLAAFGGTLGVTVAWVEAGDL